MRGCARVEGNHSWSERLVCEWSERGMCEWSERVMCECSERRELHATTSDVQEKRRITLSLHVCCGRVEGNHLWSATMMCKWRERRESHIDERVR